MTHCRLSGRVRIRARNRLGQTVDHTKEIEKYIQDLLVKQKLAVLSTHTPEGHPYASLVAFAASEDMRRILFATPNTTRKYANLMADPKVSLLIDNRSNRDTDIHKAMAVTVLGIAEPVGKADDQFFKLYLPKHPYLEGFLRSPTCAWIRVNVHCYNLVRSFQKVMKFYPDVA